MQKMLSTARTLVAGLHPPSFRVRPGWYGGAFALIVLFALILRLWGLDGRAMHYDESLHLNYSWSLAVGEGYSHSPWMHGPFQVHLTAFMFTLFSDSDFTGRLAYALFGTILVALPYFFRAYIGRAGALIAATPTHPFTIGALPQPPRTKRDTHGGLGSGDPDPALALHE